MPKNRGDSPRRIERTSATQRQRRRTYRQEDTGSIWKGRKSRTAAIIPDDDAHVTTASISSSVPDTRLAAQSGNALNVIPHPAQYQRRMRIPAGRFRP